MCHQLQNHHPAFTQGSVIRVTTCVWPTPRMSHTGKRWCYTGTRTRCTWGRVPRGALLRAHQMVAVQGSLVMLLVSWPSASDLLVGHIQHKRPRRDAQPRQCLAHVVPDVYQRVVSPRVSFPPVVRHGAAKRTGMRSIAVDACCCSQRVCWYVLVLLRCYLSVCLHRCVVLCINIKQHDLSRQGVGAGAAATPAARHPASVAAAMHRPA